MHQILSQPDIEGITISGGEPYLQQAALCELIDAVRSQRDFGVIVYTGMIYEEVAEQPLTKCCDVLIDGEYIDALNDDLSLRGSSNQRIICITDRYIDAVNSYYGCPGRKMEFFLNNEKMTMIGIPSKNIASEIK